MGVKKKLDELLPIPRIVLKDGKYQLENDRPKSIGKVRAFFGNFAVLVRAYAYIRMHGGNGLVSVSENAVLNSNYLKEQLKDAFEMPYSDLRKHEFVMSGRPLKAKGLKTMDFAKRLLDYGFHAPTVYFPLVVDEAIMIEPTETESRETLDRFAEACKKIVAEDPELLRTAPHNTARSRLNEAKAARDMIFSWRTHEKKMQTEQGKASSG